MKNLTASFLLAVSILAHGFWRAGNKLHHFFGAILVVLVAVVVFPVAIVRRAIGKKGHRHDGKSEQRFLSGTAGLGTVRGANLSDQNRQMSTPSLTSTLDFLAASARSRKIAASAWLWVLRRSVDIGHSFTAQQGFRRQGSSCGRSDH